MWTAATPAELADLFDDAGLRSRAETFLRLVAGSVDGIETLLIFDEGCSQLALALSLRPEPADGCVWDWIGISRAQAG